MKRVLLLFTLVCFFSTAQNQKDSLSTKYQKNSIVPIEVVHLHINKSSFVAGEDLPFGAYVLERNSRLPSVLTKNLYVIIEDNDGKRIDEKLLKVNNGFTNGVFTLSSELELGYYKIRAYTNFMRNNSSPNSFETTIKILDPTVENENISNVILEPIVEFKPESGNLISDISNNIAVMARKDNFSFEIKDGMLMENGIPLKSFKTSKSGLGRLSFTPKYGAIYEAKVNWNGIEYNFELPFVEKEGVIVSVNQLKEKAIVNIKMNDHSFQLFKDAKFTVALHDGSNIKVIPLKIEKKSTVLAVKNEDVSPGVNYVTLFNEALSPIAERAFFNKKTIPSVELSEKQLQIEYDSLKVSIGLNGLDVTTNDSLNFFTVSVLPLQTKALNTSLNLLGSMYINPYVNIHVDQPLSFLEKESRMSDFQMDNLMMGAAMQVYDWDKIFKDNLKFDYSFEQGLTVNVLKDTKKNRSLMIYPLANSNAQTVELKKNEETAFNQIYPQSDESLRVSLIGDKGQFVKPDLKFQVFPNVVPPLDPKNDYHDYDVPNIYINSDKPIVNSDAQRLDEVLLVADFENRRKDSIVSKAKGRVDVFTDEDRLKLPSLTNYLNASFPYEAFINAEGTFVVADRRMSRSDPTFVLDNILLNDAEFLLNVEVSTIDYVEVDNTGVFNGRFFGGDIIKIYTNPNLRNTYDRNVQNINFPISFEVDRKYYQPLYASYTDELFQRAGVLGWAVLKNKCSDGKLEFSVPYRGVNEVFLIIEGMTGSGKLVSESFVLSIND